MSEGSVINTSVASNAAAPADNWAFSSNEEEWNGEDGYPSREHAVEAARDYYADELDEGDSFYTGTVEPVTAQALAERVACAESMVEEMEEHLYEILGDVVDTEIKSTLEQRHELERDVAAVVEAWLTKHGLAPKVFTVENIETHEMEEIVELPTATVIP